MAFHRAYVFIALTSLTCTAFFACGGGSSSTSPGTGGTGTGGITATGGTHTGGGTSTGGSGGTTPQCAGDGDCLSTQTCESGACKLKDGQDCTADAECANKCVEGKCTNLKANGETCSDDRECNNTCIAGICAAVSGVAGPCDQPGAGGAGGGGGGASGASPDCQGTLECVAGTCLTPDGGSCADNVDCINTCINNVCKPISYIDGACDEVTDCSTASPMICQSGECKLAVGTACDTNAHCGSGRCMCADAACRAKTCKASSSVCLCKFSTTNTCDASSANLNAGVRDPQGCDELVNKYCDGAGNCVPDSSGTCTANACAAPDANYACGATTVASNLCNSTYNASTGCTLVYVGKTFFCSANCSCVP